MSDDYRKTSAIRRIEHRLAVARGQPHEAFILMRIACELNDNVFWYGPECPEWRELRDECAKLAGYYTGGQCILAPYIWYDIKRLKEEGYAQSEPGTSGASRPPGWHLARLALGERV